MDGMKTETLTWSYCRPFSIHKYTKSIPSSPPFLPEGDPTNYLTFFRRGTVYFALGKARNALVDFSKALELKPDFVAARSQRGNVYMKMGDYANAELDYYAVLQFEPHNEDVHYMYSRVEPAREQWNTIQHLIVDKDYLTAIHLISQMLELSPWSSLFRETRADCYVQAGDYLGAVSDYRSVNRLSQDSTAGFYRLSKLLYSLGHTVDALKEIRECLKLDPEHSDCFPYYKKIKKVDKALTDAQQAVEERQYDECSRFAKKALAAEKDVGMVIFTAKQLLCQCLAKEEQFTEALQECNDALELHKDAGVLCDRAEAYLGAEQYDDAIHDYQDAMQLDEHSQRAREGLERAKKMQKQSERRDYYKILNVKRTATKKEIVKAYRTAAQKWHPDNFRDGDEKKKAEKKFIDIAAAKEVLTDEEKRRQFDQGEDPLDPEGNRGQGGFNPHHHQFFQQGSPFQFKFHFN